MTRRLLPPAAIVLFAAVFFAPELVGGRLAVTGNMARWLPWAEDATAEARTSPSVSLDSNLSYYPRRAMLHRAWSEGQMPYWNPYSFCGTPFLSDVQSGVLYPPNWFLQPMEPGRQLGWFLFLHTAWAGLGMMALARGRGVPIFVALAAGAACVLNGYFAKHFGQPTFLATAAWMPWVLHLALDLARRPSWRAIALLSLAGAMTFLAGQPQLAFLTAYAAVLVVMVALWTRRGEASAPGTGRVALALAAAGVVAGMLAAAQLLPTRTLAALSARAELPWSTIVSGALHPAEWIRFLVPEFFGSPLTTDEWSPLFPRGDGFYIRHQINSVFAGTPVFLLALWGMTARRTWRAALPFTALFAAAIALTFGSPLARLAYEALPGFRFSRIDRAGSLVVLAQIVPAALAAHDLATARGWARRVFGGVAIAAALGLVWLVSARGAQLPAMLGADLTNLPGGVLDAERVSQVVERTRWAAAFAAATGLAFLLPPSWIASRVPLVLACAQLFVFASPYRLDRAPDEVFAPSPGIERLRSLLDDGGKDGGGRFVRFARDMPIRPYPLSAVLPPSTNVPYGLRDLQGYNALADRKLGEALETALGENVFSHGIWTGRRIVAPERAASMEHPLLDALAVRAAVSASPFSADGWIPMPARGFRLARNKEALPRVRLVGRGRGVSPEEMAEMLAAGRLDPAAEAVWIGEGEAGDATAGTSPGTVEVLKDTWNELEVRVNAAREVVLVVADQHSPGWTGRVDFRVDILPVYGLVRGVVLPAGVCVVQMRYEPPGFRVGVALSLLGLALVGTALAMGRGAGTL